MRNALVLIGTDENVAFVAEKLKDKVIVDICTKPDEKSLHDVAQRCKDRDAEAIICSDNYLSIGKHLFDEGIDKYYVCLNGFFFCCESDELMQPIDLFSHVPYKKKSNATKTILFARQEGRGADNWLANCMKKRGFGVCLLNMGLVSENDLKTYDECFELSSMNAIRKFVVASEIDMIYCYSGSNVLANIIKDLNVPVVYEIEKSNVNSVNLILENMAYKHSSGLVCQNPQTKEFYEKQFGKSDCLFVEVQNEKDEEENGLMLERLYENVRGFIKE